MAYQFYNPNPVGRFVKDCMPRALTKALDIDWDAASVLLCNAAIKMGTVECSNEVMSAVLRQYGFNKASIDDNYPDDYTAEDFCKDYNKGIYILGFGDHVCTLIDGVIFDSFNSSLECPIYYWYKK